MTLAEHLRELRNRLVKAAIAVVAGTVAGWFLYDRVYLLLREPLDHYIRVHPDRAGDVKLILNGITTAFSLQLNVAIFIGLIISSPAWLYQAWAFIVPGLTTKERRISVAFIAASVPLFVVGIVLAHWSLPLVVGVLLNFTPTGAANFQNLSDYISFVTRFSLGFGFAFLLPVFLVALNMIGILPSRTMLRVWRPAVFGIFVFAAMMMPTPDPYSMLLLAVPLTILYFAAVLVARLLDRRKSTKRLDWLDVDDEHASSL